MKNLIERASVFLVLIFSVLAIHNAYAADWDPKFSVLNGSTSNWYLTVYAGGPGPNGYNNNTTAPSVVTSVTVEVLNALSANAVAVKSYNLSPNGWYAIHWATGLEGQADGTPMRISARTNDGKTARTKPFRFKQEQPALEGASTPPAVSVSISPSAATVQSGKVQQFSATVTGSTNAGVTWSLIEGSSCGSISSSGLYTAPIVASGTICHPRATSNGGTGKSASATVTVTVPTTPQPPVISSFTADKSVIQAGETVRLTGVFSNGSGVINPGNLPIASGVFVTVSPTVTTTYSLIVSNASGNASRSQSIGVTPGGPAVNRWVSGYYATYQQNMYPPEKIDWSGLTHIIVTRIKANSDGTLNRDFDIGDNGALAARIANLAHQNGKKAILQLGGEGQGQAIQSAVRNHRAQFIANLVQAMNQYGFDGLDLNWEDYVDWDLFVVFAKDLRQALPNAILTLPGGVINGNYQTVEPRQVTVVQYVDQFNLMTYSPITIAAGGGWWSWHTSPLKGAKGNTPVSIEDTFNRYVKAGVPKQKLGMGIGFYAVCYTGSVIGPNQSTENGVRIVGGDNEFPLSELFGVGGAYSATYRQWDNVSLNSYLSLPQPERHGCRYVSFEDEASILAKGQFARDNGYGGIIVWTINQGYVKSHSQPNFLMQALRKGFISPDAQQTVDISVLQGNIHMKPSTQLQFGVLVTGSADKVVTWSVTGAGCGSISSTGLYTAPGNANTCQVVARHNASGKTASSKVTVTNTSWSPGFHLTRQNTCWTQVITDDASTLAISFKLADGTTQNMWLHGTEYGSGKPIFATNYCFAPAGGTHTFSARSVDNRTAEAALLVPAFPR